MKIEYGKKMIGEYENNVFKKAVKKSKHLFRKLDAWGIDGKYFAEVLLPNNALIKITDKEENKTYTIQAEEMDKKGQYFHFKGKEDYGNQIFCPRKYWETL
jgi:hypothetical protein